MTTLPPAGGWSFAADPDLGAAAAPALWRPTGCSLVAIAEPSPSGFAGARPGELAAAAPIAAEYLERGDWHVVLTERGRRLRLQLRRCAANEPLAYLCPADRGAAARLAVAAAVQAALGRGARWPPAGAPGRSERWRLVQWLRLLDALAGGASAREAAAALLASEVAAYSATEWDASSERRRIGRWQRAAIAMRDGGYRQLLAP
ncbi:DUF2285 domain-containing protein [Sphingopyxis sp. JAI108]|uniref:DUF2285 domain-containing protein n=1 Tax=Sphingopyxis sp. JAI108 TaxID=2723060 RepID=UPI00181AA1CD|nr:DUF2285 domain-containing protein [Sphingopyxis sp. JAI108]NYF32542.1 hypothetical protein [Sphingopyxis sp. JAI108]